MLDMVTEPRSLSAADASVKPSKLAHVVLRSGRYQQTLNWYLTVLNADIVFGNDFVTFLRYDDEHHRLGIVNAPDSDSVNEKCAGADHISFTYSTLADLLGTYLRLKSAGIEPFWPIIHGPTISLYYRDPDGGKVELQLDVFETVEEVDEFFEGGNYLENFMGVIFDPDDMVRRYREGEPISSLTARPPLPPGLTAMDMFRP